MCQRLACSALIAAALAGPLGAQTIRVQTVETETRRAIAGALVTLLDDAGQRVTQGLTTDAGWVRLVAPRPGTYRLRADRIGHAGILGEPLSLRDSLTIVLSMPTERVLLPEVTVAGESRCDRVAEGAVTAALWEEVRKGLSANQLTIAAQATPLSVRQFRRYRTLRGTVRADSTFAEFTTLESPFIGPDPETLRTQGFVHEIDGQFRFVAPDAQALLSEAFLEEHCFQIVRDERRQPNLIGLGFQPVRDRRLPEIRGVLWVDRGSAELRHLEFDYVNVPAPVRAAGLGGRLEFERLTSGAWIIRDWYIRIPHRVRIEQRVGYRGVSQRDSVIGFIDQGGIVRVDGDASIALGEVAARTVQTTKRVVSLRGRVVSSDGEPLEGARIAVDGLDSVLATDRAGAFHLADHPPGTVRLVISAIGHVPGRFGITLRDERLLVDTVFALERAAQRLDSIVVAESAQPFRSAGTLEFERRRAMGFGSFLTRQELNQWGPTPVSASIRVLGGFRLMPRSLKCGGGFALASGRGLNAAGGGDECVDTACYVAVYVNGSQIWTPGMGAPPDIERYLASELDAVEIYRGAGQLPPELQSTGAACGAIVLWTRTSNH